MKLDRNIPGGHGNKYGLIKNRELEKTRDSSGHFPAKIADALLTLVDAGILDWGCTPETEFFAIRLRDCNAPRALHAYSDGAALSGDMEYAREVEALAIKAARNPCRKRPD